MIAVSGSAHTIAELQIEATATRVLYEALLIGSPATWRDICPAYTCGDKTGAAIDEAYQQMCEAQADLDRALKAGAR